MSVQFTDDLSENIKVMQTVFSGDNTFITRRVRSPAGLSCAVFFFDGMVNNTAINESVIRPLVHGQTAGMTAEAVAQGLLQINDCKVVDVYKRQVYGIGCGSRSAYPIACGKWYG